MEQTFRDSLALYDDFLARTGPDRLQKILARCELFRMVMEVPGDIVECGVYKGSGIYTYAKLRHIFKPGSVQKIVGFDFFEAERDADVQHQIDQEVLEMHMTGWASRKQILGNLHEMGIEDIELIAGDVAETTKTYVAENVGFRIALLYLDVDNYEATLAALQNLYSHVTLGGIIAFDEYAHRGHGEADAVDEYLDGKNARLKSIPWANTPTAYFVKNEE